MDDTLRLRIGAVIGLLLGVTANDVAARESYYVMVFASQSHPKLSRYTHTWATFVRAVGEAAADTDAYALQAHTISWLPAAIAIRPWNPHPEAGANLDLYQTIAVVTSQGERITMWGPFVIDGPTYHHSVDVARFFASGAPRYRAFSTRFTRPTYNCITAIGALGMGIDEGVFPPLLVGYPSGRHFARQFMARSPYDRESGDHSWLIARLGLDRYPIAVVAPPKIAASGGDSLPCRFSR
jgi:hypothetical protein